MTGLNYERLTTFVQQTVFGQGSYGRVCRICLADDYIGEIVHEPWCEEIRGLVILRAQAQEGGG